jgi:hypothetical protein
MNQQSKSAQRSLRKESGKSKPIVLQVGPSVDADHQPVSENDNSANLFEDNIKKMKKNEQC